MERICFFLLGLSWLALAGCSRDSKAPETATGQPGPAPVGMLGNPTLKTAPERSEVVSSSARVDVPHLKAPRRRPQAEVSVPAKPVSTLPAGKPQGNTAPATLANAPEPETPSTVQQAGLSDIAALSEFMATGLAPPQVFSVQPGRDTLLIGSQGTQIFMPANACDVPAGSGPVQLSLREFYSTADIVLAGLSTTSSGQLLETGGMLNLTASTAAGTPVLLRDKASLQLRMPTKAVKPDMQLFRGQHQPGTAADPSINWVLDSTTSTQTFSFDLEALKPKGRKRKHKRINNKALRDEWPVYLAGERRQKRGLVQAVTYPADTFAKLRRNHKRSAKERAFIYAYNKYLAGTNAVLEKIRRVAEVEFTVDSTGATTNAKVRPGYDTELAAPLLNEVKSWQNWKPARLSRAHLAGPQMQYGQTKKPAPVVGTVRVLITISGKIIVIPPAWDYSATDELLRFEQAKAYRARVAAAVALRDTVARGGQTAGMARQASPTAADLFYELQSAGMGWINCDRFLNSPQPLFTMELDAPALSARMMLVFRDSRTIAGGVPDAVNGKMLFGRLPTGVSATLVAIRWQQGQAEMAIKPLTLSAANKAEALDYKLVTILDLQAALAAL